VNRCHLIADHQRRYGVKRLCTIIGLARSTFYHWVSTGPERAAREAADTLLATQIRQVHTESAGTYGAPRVTAELRDTGLHINRKRVARVMRKFGIAGLRLRRRHRTTIADQAATKAPDLLMRNFTAERDGGEGHRDDAGTAMTRDCHRRARARHGR
jgi:transposase InsO family protein